jgi:predicted SnoaL-like aldol condensation-catalyzing enzyme
LCRGGDLVEVATEKNKKTVREFYDMALNQKKPEEAVSKYVGKVYRQHNPNAGDGGEAFISFVKGFVKQYPELHFDFKRFIAEGDLVVVHMPSSHGDLSTR